MKKIFLSALILVCLFFGFKATVSATVSAGAPATNVSISTVKAERGDAVSVFVSVTGSDEAKALMVASITYDTDMLEFISGSWLLDGAVLFENYNVIEDNAVIAFDSPVDINKNIFEIVFRVKDDAAYGVSNISCDVLEQWMEYRALFPFPFSTAPLRSYAITSMAVGR